MNPMRIKKWIIGTAILVESLALLLAALYLLYQNHRFPGKITESPYEAEIQGNCATFRQGTVYRYPGLPPMLEVRGDYFEMGLQYGVLLRNEIHRGIQAYEEILRWMAGNHDVPYPLFSLMLMRRAAQIADRLPKRFHEEIRGIALGSGVPVNTIQTVSLLYDVLMSGACSSVLMRGSDGTIIHGRNNDTGMFGGEAIPDLYVVVRHCAAGNQAVTHIDPVLFMGVETGYNACGITFSEETVGIRQPDKNGFSLPYLVRMTLEECCSLQEVRQYVRNFNTIGGYGSVWSDLMNGDGMLLELTPGAQKTISMSDPIFWNFNRFESEQLKQQQTARSLMSNFNSDRITLAQHFPSKSEYTVDDAFDFLALQRLDDSTSFVANGSRAAICNSDGTQMVVFEPNQQGFYLAIDTSFAARQKIYRIFDDFSRRPRLVRSARPVDPVLKEIAAIENRLFNNSERLRQYAKLAQKYPNHHQCHFKAAVQAFKLKQWDIFAKHARRAYALNPENGEFQFYGALAALLGEHCEKAIRLLTSQDLNALSPELQMMRYSVLSALLKSGERAEAQNYAMILRKLIERYNARAYYEQTVTPRLRDLMAVRPDND